ncbi:MAG: DUF3352 domain-containing protein [Fimbriimonas sp.]
MNAANSSAPRLRRWGVRAAVGATLFASLAGALAFRSLMARPGEAALRLVPANAVIVATLDLSPSASQVIAFKRIDDALARNGLNGFMESSLIDMFEPSAKGREALRPLVLRNGAVAILPKDSGKFGDGNPVAMLAVSSGADAQKALEREGEARYYKGLKYYKLRHGSQLYMVVDDLLIVAQEPTALLAVKGTRDGGANITSVDSFVASRATVADDANIMLFLSPKMLTEGPKGTEALMADWMTVGMAVRDGGIGISFGGAADTSKEPALATLGQTQPVRNDLFRMLPSGMYGSMVYSQPSKTFEAVEKGFMKDADMKKSIKEMETDMRKEVGIDLRKDLIPAFHGTTIVAAYPSTKSVAGVDALFVIDDLNGADPANAVDRFTHWMSEQMEKEGQSVEMFDRKEVDGVTYFRLAHEQEEEMQKSFGEGLDEGPVRKDALMGDKTIAWAVVGKAILASSNQALLERAVASYRTNADNLASDPKFAPIQSDVIDGSQQIGMFSLARIAEGVKNTMNLEKMDKEGAKTFQSILGAFETLDQPFTTKMRMMPSGRFAGGTFIPLDYDKMLNFAGDLKKGDKK